MKKITALLLALALTVCALGGCSAAGDPGPSSPALGNEGIRSTLPPEGGPVDLLASVEPEDAPAIDGLEGKAAAVTDFSVRLFQQALGEGSALVSPLSVLYALSMTANGAKGETLAQMEEVLGLDVQSLNQLVRSYTALLPREEKCSLSLANSIWFTDDGRFTVNRDFLQTCAAYYDADLYQTAFNDAACDAINAWVEEKTDGMIEEILNEIPADAVMYLINALAFDAEWAAIYSEDDVREGIFTTEDGTEQSAELMWSEESRYLEDELATGFLKYYAGGTCAFVALLPKEGVSVADYAASLTGEGLHALLSAPQDAAVTAAIPKFESEYAVELSAILAGMGMPDAFSERAADFSGLGSSTEGNIFINRVLHKTFISVDERGTRAGAATAVEITLDAAIIMTHEVILDRPFVYLLLDCENGIPLFIGTVTELG